MYYVMGGSYQKNPPDGTYVFDLVKPKGGFVYVHQDPKWIFDNCKHHAHLYKLSEDLLSVRLVRPSYEALKVAFPDFVRLTEELVESVRKGKELAG